MKRKNRIVTLIVAAITTVIMTLTGCTTTTAASKTGWKYYDEFMEYISKNPTAHAAPAEMSYDNFAEPSGEILAVIDAAKDAVRKSLGSYQDLDWPHFDTVPIIVCDISDDYGAVALYAKADDCIYFSRSALENYDIALVTNTMAHELIHVLAPPAKRTNIDEAMTVRLANGAYPCDTINYPFSYVFVDRYLKTHGEKEAIDAMRNGTLIDEIEADIGQPKVLSNTDGLFEGANSGAFNNESLFVIIDIYAHYVMATGGLDDSSVATINYLLSNLSDTTESREAMEYFSSLLK